MGWKKVRDHYQVEHTVQVTDAGICIGSPYIPDIIVIGLDGVVKKRYESGRTNEDLRRIQDAFDADPEKLKELVLSPDTFCQAITVYTYRDLRIITFPTKHNWKDKTDLELIRKSCRELMEVATKFDIKQISLPKPGCSNGGLVWDEVRAAIAPLLNDDIVTIVDKTN